MINRYTMLITVCLFTSPLMCMQIKKKIKTADELELLALESNPQEYEKKLNEYTVLPLAIINSAKNSLQSQLESPEINSYVKTLCEYNSSAYKKLCVQMMTEYYAKHNNQISLSGTIQANINKIIEQQISQKESDINEEETTQHNRGAYVFMGGMASGFFAVTDLAIFIVILIKTLSNNSNGHW